MQHATASLGSIQAEGHRPAFLYFLNKLEMAVALRHLVHRFWNVGFTIRQGYQLQRLESTEARIFRTGSRHASLPTTLASVCIGCATHASRSDVSLKTATDERGWRISALQQVTSCRVYKSQGNYTDHMNRSTMTDASLHRSDNSGRNRWRHVTTK